MTWKTGFEIELLAPFGSSRETLARALADHAGGDVARIFHPQSEPSKVPGMPVFENLTLGFRVTDRTGAPVATCVDDLTIRADLSREAKPAPGWYRILSDDARMLHLALCQCDPRAAQAEVLAPLAKVFGTTLVDEGGEFYQVKDRAGNSVALAATLPGERDRPCEIISPPLAHSRKAWLDMTLSHAARLGFTVPTEAAVHLHFDAERLRSARVVQALVTCLIHHGPAFRSFVGTNANCVRLGTIPSELGALVSQPGFARLRWAEALKALRGIELTKYADFNFLNLIGDDPEKSTFEVRILPGSLDADEIHRHVLLFEKLLVWCEGSVEARPEKPLSFPALLAEIETTSATRPRLGPSSGFTHEISGLS